MRCEKELVMGSEKEGFQTTQRPPQEVSRRPRTLQGLEVGANLAPRGVPKSIQNRSKSELGSLQNPRPHPPRGAPGKENDTKIEEKTINFDAEDMQKKASIPLCFSTVLGRKIGGTVPKKGEHSVFFFVRMQCIAMQCNTLQYNVMQCNAMQ